ncbi:MAG: protoporphyrinogen oxidase [Planctomycetota bacterium]
MAKTKKQWGVIGGGIAGLAAAYELQQLVPENDEVILLEASERLGGVLKTESRGDFLVEHSADMFSTDPAAALQLCRELGLEDELLTTIATENRAFVATENGIQPIPAQFSLMLPGDVDAVLNSKILSDAGKERFLEEANVPARHSDQDESLQSFATRRFGQEVFAKLIQPLASGIYTADPQQLSMNATMSRFIKLERKHGSLIAAGKAARQATKEREGHTSGARYGLFRAPEQGTERLVSALIDRMKRSDKASVSMQTGARVSRLVHSKDRFRIECHAQTPIDCDGIILATPSFASCQLLKGLQPNSAAGNSSDWDSFCQNLASIEFASSAIVLMSIQRNQLDRPFSGYGIIFPDSLGRQAIAISFANNKFSGRAPSDSILARVFIGGALNSQLVELDDQALTNIAHTELSFALGLTGQANWTHVVRWRESMPQYTLGHLERVAEIDRQVTQLSGLELAGKSYHGVGIPACIASGRSAAQRLLQS